MFHPAVQQWFDTTHGQPTDCQVEAWPAIGQGQNVLIAAPTGSGKTLAAFLAAIDELTRELEEFGSLPDEVRILYVSPLKALSNDIEKNLRDPLNAINHLLAEAGASGAINAAVRTGDTSTTARARMKRQPPHILVTTPESLFILLTSESGREMLRSVRSVIVDEIHALAANKRGAHLSLSLERLCGLTDQPPARVGLSATQKPLSRVAEFLCGPKVPVKLVDSGVQRERDLNIVMPDSPLDAVMSAEVWGEVHRKLAELVEQHSTTLIFVNTRRQAERIAKQLAERLGEDAVTSHHGSLSKEHRLNAELRLKNGELKALVATASLELGIDIGDVDLVCQLGSPRSVSVFLQRVGRSGHGVGRVPKGRLFPLSRDDLVESAALLRASREGRLDEICLPHQPLDVLAQQIVAEVANQTHSIEELFDKFAAAGPYQQLSKTDFEQILQMLAEGFATRRGRRGAMIHVDLVNRLVSGRKGARLTALTNGGAIPDLFDYDVIMEPEGMFVGTLNEDFAFESLAGDIFQLGNTSYRILRVEKGVVRVVDAKGQPPNIPFWFGEAPGRGDTLSESVSELRADINRWMTEDPSSAEENLRRNYRLDEVSAQQIISYLGAAWQALGQVLPTREHLVAERFFDQAGDMHVVIHSTFGSRMNRAFGLALRKRFCRRFNFELQAAALEDCIVLSLGETHSFDLQEVAGYLHPDSVRQVLIQALLDAPVFPTHWRWVSNISLAVKRFRNGKKVPAQFQRSDAEDLVAVVFPEQLACFENIQGEREVPDHPLVNQTLWDCLNEVMDIARLEQVLKDLRGDKIQWISRDLVAPSPLAEEIINAKPYAFLDDAPAEERRTLAVQTRGVGKLPEDQADYSRLDPAAIAQVKNEAWPDPRSADELHDAIVCGGYLTESELASLDSKGEYQAALISQKRISRAFLNDVSVWVAAERLNHFHRVFPGARLDPPIDAVQWGGAEFEAEQALAELVRSRLEILGPVTSASIGESLGVAVDMIEQAMQALAGQGFAIAGRFDPDSDETQWCDRRLLARIHRYTLKSLRAEIEPVSLSVFMGFLFNWQHLDSSSRMEGSDGVAEVISQLEGFGAPLKQWESALLPSRVHAYIPGLLDQLGMSGRIEWRRSISRTPKAGSRYSNSSIGNVPVSVYIRESVQHWYDGLAKKPDVTLSKSTQHLKTILDQSGACFYDDLKNASRMLPAQLETALAELVGAGLITCDSFEGFRALLVPQSRRQAPGRVLQRRSRRLSSRRIERAGRWSVIEYGDADNNINEEQLEYMTEVLLHRYGVVSRAVIDQESGLPPWRLLLPVLRRLEARGEVRGGRFVGILAGEQFALPEAVELLRKQRKTPGSDTWVRLHACDPLNFTGSILPLNRVSGNQWLLFRNGSLVAVSGKDGVNMIGEHSPEHTWKIREMLLVSPGNRGGVSMTGISLN